MSTPTGPTDFRDRIIYPHRPEDGVPGDDFTSRLVVTLAGEVASGKTTAAASFPDPLFLLSDPNKARHEAMGVPYLPIGGESGYRRFAEEILPAINRRDPFFTKFQTIILDTVSFLQFDIRDTIENLDDPKKTRTAYGELKRSTLEPLRVVGKLAVPPKPGAHTWNVVFNVHIGLVYKEIADTGSGRERRIPDKYKPLLEGAARDGYGAAMDTSLLIQSEMVQVAEPGKALRTERRFYAYSQPPPSEATLYSTLCYDRVGGKLWKKLPPRIDITDRSLYEELCRCWGLPGYAAKEPK